MSLCCWGIEAPPTGPSGSFILNQFGCKHTLKQCLLLLFCAVNPNGGVLLQTGVRPRRRVLAATVRAAQCHASVFIGKTLFIVPER